MDKYKFNLQLFAAELPDNPESSPATVGKDYLLSVNVGTAATPEWALIGGQQNSSLARKADSIDASHKTSGGWKVKKAGLKEWSVDLSGLILLDADDDNGALEEGLQALDDAFMDGKDANLKFQYPSGAYRTGWAAVTDYEFDVPHDGAAKIKGTLEGNGALSELKMDYAISPTSATVSIAAAVDKQFAISPSSATVSNVKNGAAVLTATTDYTYSSGTLTLKSTYLSGLTAGSDTITVTLGNGTALVIALTVTE